MFTVFEFLNVLHKISKNYHKLPFCLGQVIYYKYRHFGHIKAKCTAMFLIFYIQEFLLANFLDMGIKGFVSFKTFKKPTDKKHLLNTML